MKRLALELGVLVTLVSCTSVGFQDKNVYVMDGPNQNLRAHDQKNDRHLSDCDPQILPSGQIEYKCVAHFLADYQAILVKINALEKDLESCQQGNVFNASIHP